MGPEEWEGKGPPSVTLRLRREVGDLPCSPLACLLYIFILQTR